MRNTAIIAALLACAAAPMRAEQSQAYFSQAVDICLAFSPDGFMVTDRLEEKGWRAAWDAYFETTTLTTPGGTVLVVPPPENGELPATCRVISQTVGIVQAEGAVRFVLGDNNIDYQQGSLAGCTVFETAAGAQIQIFSDGQDDFCSDPDSARVDIVIVTDPLAGQ